MAALQKTQLIGQKDKPQTECKYLQNTYLIKGLYPKYTKNSYNSTIRNNSKIGKRSDKKHQDKQMVNMHQKSCSTSHIIREKAN